MEIHSSRKIRTKTLGSVFISFALIGIAGICFLCFIPAAHGVTADQNKNLHERILKIQMPFVENQGQIADEHVRFYIKTFGGTLYVTDAGEMIYSSLISESKRNLKNRHLKHDPVRSEDRKIWILKETLVGASKVSLKGIDKAETKANYFIGNDKSKWKTDLTAHNEVSLGEIYEGIDLRLKAYARNVEKIFTIKPSAEVDAIKLKMDGANSLKINERGELVVETGLGAVSFAKPVAYQEINGKRYEVKVGYLLRTQHSALNTHHQFMVSKSVIMICLIPS